MRCRSEITLTIINSKHLPGNYCNAVVCFWESSLAHPLWSSVETLDRLSESILEFTRSQGKEATREEMCCFFVVLVSSLAAALWTSGNKSTYDSFLLVLESCQSCRKHNGTSCQKWLRNFYSNSTWFEQRALSKLHRSLKFTLVADHAWQG